MQHAPSFYLLLLMFGAGVGVASGLLGIGGGILLVPGLVLLFQFTQAEAQGTSLAVLIPPIGIFAALVYYRHGYVELPVVGWLAGGFLVGAYLGAQLVPWVPPAALRVAFGALLLCLGVYFVMTPRERPTAAALPAGLAATAAALLARLWRRRRVSGGGRHDAPRHQPPGDDLDYHI